MRLPSLFLALVPFPALADAPRVMTDIAPVHSLVARVMQGVGSPDLLIEQSSSPHHVQLRPSQARNLDRAELLVWIGPQLTPWLDRALKGLSPGQSLVLLDTPGTVQRDFAGHSAADHVGPDHGRQGAHLDGQTDGHEDKHGDEHTPDHPKHDAHEDHGGRASHAHTGQDPHAWLDPVNAATWVDAIARELAQLDPEHAALYQENAATARADLQALSTEIQTRLNAAAPLAGMVTAHQAYGHFAARFNVPIIGHVSLSDAAAPSAAHLSDLHATLAEHDTLCLFTEPQLNRSAVETISEDLPDGISANLGTLDPLGSRNALGPDLYPALIRDLGQAFLTCAE